MAGEDGTIFNAVQNGFYGNTYMSFCLLVLFVVYLLIRTVLLLIFIQAPPTISSSSTTLRSRTWIMSVCLSPTLLILL